MYLEIKDYLQSLLLNFFNFRLFLLRFLLQSLLFLLQHTHLVVLGIIGAVELAAVFLPNTAFAAIVGNLEESLDVPTVFQIPVTCDKGQLVAPDVVILAHLPNSH